MSDVCKPFKYEDTETPEGYICQGCQASGVRLYRDWNTFLSHQRITCRACTIKENQDPWPEKPEYLKDQKEHQLHGKCAAVPTEEGDTYWGFSSVPDCGVKWWDNLPKESTR